MRPTRRTIVRGMVVASGLSGLAAVGLRQAEEDSASADQTNEGRTEEVLLESVSITISEGARNWGNVLVVVLRDGKRVRTFTPSFDPGQTVTYQIGGQSGYYVVLVKYIGGPEKGTERRVRVAELAESDCARVQLTTNPSYDYDVVGCAPTSTDTPSQ